MQIKPQHEIEKTSGLIFVFDVEDINANFTL